jgi:hypothetical protein
MSNIKLILVFIFNIFCNLIINININSNMDTKSTSITTSTNTINNQQEQQPQTHHQNNDIYSGITLCKFCTAKLSYGMDSNSMVHCQDCHNVWDGFAQCRCDFWLN